jgi:hypothetical protein
LDFLDKNIATFIDIMKMSFFVILDLQNPESSNANCRHQELSISPTIALGAQNIDPPTEQQPSSK